jgi:polar amino acid transport system substrate-binding protein
MRSLISKKHQRAVFFTSHIGKTFILLMTLVLLIFLHAVIAIAEPGELIIGKPNTDYPPFHWTDENGQIKGICPDVILAAANLIGINKITYEPYPWRRMLEKAENGDVDAVMPLFKTPERSKYLFFPEEELAFEVNVFFTLADSDINYSGDFQELKSFRIGSITGYSYGSLFDNADFKREYAVNEKMLLNKLQAQRYRIGIGNLLVLKHFSRQMGLAIKILKPKVSRGPLFIGFTKIKDNQNLVKEFSGAINKLKLTGKYLDIVNKYKQDVSNEKK